MAAIIGWLRAGRTIEPGCLDSDSLALYPVCCCLGRLIFDIVCF